MLITKLNKIITLEQFIIPYTRMCTTIYMIMITCYTYIKLFYKYQLINTQNYVHYIIILLNL